MNTSRLNINFFLILIAFTLFGSFSYAEQKKPIEKLKFTPDIYIKANKFKVIKAEEKKKNLTLWIEDGFSTLPFRESTIKAVYDSAYKQLPEKYKDYTLTIISKEKNIEEYVPNIYRSTMPVDKTRIPDPGKKTSCVVKNTSKPFAIEKGLNDKNIALWNSHGWYYNINIDRWEWQRARFFGTVEDLLTTSIVLPYLMPMLENAGANVFLPRERDVQTNEVLVDNDFTLAPSSYTQTPNWEKEDEGFGWQKNVLYNKDHPFKMGSYVKTPCYEKATDSIVWKANIPENGYYYVSIGYKTLSNSTDSAHYEVYHSGGKTSFIVNQQMGSGTWIYLGKFYFTKNTNSAMNKIVLTNLGKKGTVVTADVARWGGGMGNSCRQDNSNIIEEKKNPPFVSKIDSSAKTSNRPRFAEGARYYLQWAGVPDSLIANQKKDVIGDYQDDIYSRSNWVNYLMGGSDFYPKYDGLNIPISACIALHTDSESLGKDSIIGTLGICMTTDDKGVYPAKYSRMSARDFTDILQTEIVNDVSKTFGINWTRRGIWDKTYIEARVPKTPTSLIELFSHQNFNDMKFGLSPQYRFTAARAMYKGIIKFLAFQNNTPYVITPLPVQDFAVELLPNDSVLLSWQPRIDSLETTANAEKYVVYTRINDEGFNNGIISSTNAIKLPIKQGIIYSYKITAVNEGGESFPSEILAACKAPKEKGKALIINAFDRTSAPDFFDFGNTGGFSYSTDAGVPYQYEVGYTGNQFEFDKNVPYYDNDYPGFGASQSNYEGKVLAGNTFDYAFVHGKALVNNGYSFASCSKDALTQKTVLTQYNIVDIILGNQKTLKTSTCSFELFPNPLQEAITKYANGDGKIIVTGSYVASSMNKTTEKSEASFAKNILKYKLRSPFACANGKVSDVYSSAPESNTYSFYTYPNSQNYRVQNADGVQPSDKKSQVLMRYNENNIAAAIGYKGKYRTVICGFPFECLTSEIEQINLMKMFLNFLTE